MKKTARMTTGLMLAAMVAACNPPQPPDEPEIAQPAEPIPARPPAPERLEPMPTAPVPGAPFGSMVVYACDDGSSLTVTYDEYSALVKLPAGSTMLSHAESASSGGGDAYIGEELSLYRDGNLVQLQEAGNSRICTQSPTSG